MIREVDLVSYLPPFIADYKETNAALTAENPEFVLVWKAADRALKNEFIVTADEYGISRFEKILGILPSRDDTLESRRSRVQSRWFTELPYTWRMLVKRLTLLCKDTDFILTNDFKRGYTLTIKTDLELFGQVGELERILIGMVPCNVRFESSNEIEGTLSGRFYMAGGVSFTQDICITQETGEEDGRIQ